MKTGRNDLRIRFASLTTIAAIALFVAVSIALTMTPGASAASHDMSISNFAFSPNSITIAPGDTVTWTNSDGTTHTVTGNNESWGSGNMANGQTYTHQFNETGDFTYHCAIHPSMTGVVHVTSGDTRQLNDQGLSSSTLIAIIAAIAVVAAASIILLRRRMKSKKV